ncbi:DNA-binding CsgD family transcriptional regulator [Streptacidiphilus sp. MAP12-16]|uniref:helix-turn-helix transcriptional regulator n=1 Tax=Streptacidiphilus sp. MAP12-16 TaxID=3156300 RepID=UPI003512CE05
MTPSGEAGLRRILAVIDLLLDAVDEETLLPALLPMLLQAVPGDSLTWSLRTPTGRHPISAPAGLFGPDAVHTFFLHAAADPLFRHTDTGSGVPLRRSDLQTRAEYHRLATYTDVLRPVGAEYQLAMAFPAGYTRTGRRTVCLSVNRSGRDFTQTDVAGASLLRARLTHALDRLAPPLPTPAGVTARESAVLDLLARGLTDQQIAHCLDVSARTVDKHLEHAYAKLQVHGRVEAANLWLAASTPRPRSS